MHLNTSDCAACAMEKTILYTPDISGNNIIPEDEARHFIKVLRKNIGDVALLTDGNGMFYEAQIISDNIKKCQVDILKKWEEPTSWNNKIHIAFAPTKNIDRIEWFAEKATEIGINRFTPLLCKHSERKEIKINRLERILVSAMKQSQKAVLPILDPMIPFNRFIENADCAEKYIAHCYDSEKVLLKSVYKLNSDVLIMIGPEGDFSEDEVEAALKNKFKAVSLGNGRLRTETAALVACHTIHVLNE